MQSNKLRSLFFLFLLILVSCSGSNSSQKNKGAVIGNVNDQPVYFNEVWNEYMKSNNATQDTVTLEHFKNFSSLYLDFRTKIEAAKQGGYYKDQSIASELSNYEKQYAMPFWLEKDIEKRLLDELIERSTIELKVSHILIQIIPNSPPSDTLEIYNKLLKAKKQAESGADFDSLSNVISSTRDGRSMGGALGYMSAGWAVKEFEDVAYTTPVGGISMPFTTQFGMHILKVSEKRPKVMERMMSHIFWRSGGNKVKQDSIIEVANQLRSKILKGEMSWDSVAIAYSEDGLSKKNGGKIGWIEQGKYMPIFTDSVYGLKEKGQISYGFYSGYGVHLLKLDSIKTYANEETKRAEMLSKLKNLPRYKNNKVATNKRLREISKASKNNENAKLFYEFIRMDSIKAQKMPEVTVPKKLENLPLFTMRGTSFTFNDFMAYLKSKFPKQVASDYRYNVLDDYIEEKTESFLVDMTKEQFPEFKKTAEEYQNGLVVFKISEDSVWNYVKTDTVNLKELYNQRPENFWFEKRYSFWRISSQKDSLLQLVKSELDNGTVIDSLKNKNRQVFMIEDVIADISEEPFYRLEKLEPGKTTEIFEYKKRSTILYLKEILEPRQMTFDEAYYRVVAEYQPVREKQWLENLRARYKSTLDNAALEKAFNDKKISR